MTLFKKAERRQAKLKIALTAPSGGGKTYSALTLATGIGKRIAVIDTENDSASLYGDRFEFDAAPIEAPYTVQKYIQAIQAAQAEGYDVLIVDSLSHAWAADGGLLSKKEALDARGGNSYTNWAGITKEHEQLKSAILNADIHMIVTMRSKQDYVVEQNERGKSAPRKVGLAPVQRDGMEYEFTTVFDIAMDHNASVSKDRTGLFDGEIFKITKDTGERIMAWLNGAKPMEKKPPGQQPPASKPQAVLSEAQLKRLYAIQKASGWKPEECKAYMAEKFNITSSSQLTRVQYDQICKYMETNPKATQSEEESAPTENGSASMGEFDENFDEPGAAG